MTVVQEEIFGPVVVAMPFDDEDEAIAIANGTPFGLYDYVFSADTGRAMAVAQQLRTGNVGINTAAAQPRGRRSAASSTAAWAATAARWASTPTARCSRSSGRADDGHRSPKQPDRPRGGSRSTVKGIVWTRAARGRATTSRCATCEPHEVRVRIHAAGLCHSDVSVIDGTIPFPTPVVLGHEGAGVVEEVGDAVRKVKVGDHVVLTTLGNCGAVRGVRPRRADPLPRHLSASCTRRSRSTGEQAFQFANAGVFTEHTVVSETQAVVDRPGRAVRRRQPHRLRGASPASARCSTGPRPTHGESAMVIGARRHRPQRHPGRWRLSDALPIIAVDTNPAKEAAARQFGATHFIAAGPEVDTIAAVKEICPNGVDFAFECVGHPALIRTVDRLPRLGRQLRPARRAQARHRGQLRRAEPVQRQVDHGLPLRHDPSPPRHPDDGRAVQGRSAQARRAGQRDATPPTTSSRRSTTCTTASSTAACCTFA